MEDIERMLGRYFGERLASKVGERTQEKKLTEKDIDRWLDEEA